MTCTHTRILPDRYVETEHYWTGEMEGEWEYGRTESTYEDIDLHRFKCTQCGHIEYYSGAARAYYEQGVRSPGITGLE